MLLKQSGQALSTMQASVHVLDGKKVYYGEHNLFLVLYRYQWSLQNLEWNWLQVSKDKGTWGISISTSMLFRKSFAAQQARRAGMSVLWTTFTYYLKNVTHMFMDTFSIGPFNGCSAGCVASGIQLPILW